MSEHLREDARARREAAAWFTRLGRRAVTTQSLREFREWRRAPQNAAAYARVERLWARAGALGSDPEIRAATRQAAVRPPRRRLARVLGAPGRLALALGSAAALASAALLFGPALLQPSYATRVGEERLVVLADGSRVRLNTDSRIQVRFSRSQRRILLTRGEAYFEVAHDRAHPFLVDAGGADVRALGTRFDVRREDRSVQVTLLEGSVRVRRDGGSWTLKPNQQLTLKPGKAAAPAAADAVSAVGWADGRLKFHDTPLAAAVAEVNRYTRNKIELADPGLAAAPVDGVFDTGDTRAFVAAVGMLFDLKAVPRPDGGVRLEHASSG